MGRLRRMAAPVLSAISIAFLSAAAGAAGAAEDREAGDAVYQAIASESPPDPFFSGPIPRSTAILNDAGLNDVTSVGDHVWCVGDRGVVVRSEDAGASWSTVALPVDAQLTSVSFLTDRIGFVGGVVYAPAEKRFVGMILKTSDGGNSWTVSSGSRASTLMTDQKGRTKSGLPPVRSMRFFDLENGIVVCSTNEALADAEVLRTDDGGATWKALETEAKSTKWTRAAFATSQDGVIVGRGNSFGAVVGSQLIGLASPEPVVQQVRGASLSKQRTGWLVGDGGFVLCSDNGGISWKPPQERLPESMNSILDFYDVDQRGRNVCLVGRPGTSVLMANVDGRSWRVGRLSGSVPLHCVRFVSDQVLVAAGAMGVVHRSADGGQTWRAVRNSGYRASVLLMTPDPEDVSFRMLSSVAGNEGYRAVVTQLSPQWRLGKRDDSHNSAARHAVTQAGANAFETDWMFTRNRPGHETVTESLMSAWTLQTDGNVDALLPARIAQQILTWRPDVICVERGDADSKLSEVVLQVLPQAIAMAAGDRNSESTEAMRSVGLKPWRVQRVVVRQPDGTESPLTFSADALLNRLQTGTDLVADHCRRQVVEDAPFSRRPKRDAYLAWEANGAVPTPSTLLAGIGSAPGSESRRAVSISSDHDLRALQSMLQKKSIESGALIGQAQRTETSLAVIGSLQEIGRQLPPELALRQLQELAQLYSARQNLDAEIAILKEIARRFPTKAETADAAEKLFLYYSSSELRMLRRRENLSPANPARAVERIPGIVTSPSLLSQPDQGSGIQQVGGIARPPVVRNGTGHVFGNSQGRVEDSVDIQWDRNARSAFELLQQIAPTRATAPQLLIRQAANLYRADSYAQSRTVLSRAASGDGLYGFLALAEMQGEHGLAETPLPVVHVRPVDEAPFLDGDLSDQCWQDARTIILKTSDGGANSSSPSCLVMMAWDDEFVYLSGRAEKTSRSEKMDRTRDRRHDASHGTRDRFEFSFDLDRDYTTAFHFVLDETGQTSEHCWGKLNWNPKWYVAADADDHVWRFEVAIPVQELQPNRLSAGTLWATEIRRVVPGEFEQRLVSEEEVSTDPAAVGRGLLRFLRKRR